LKFVRRFISAVCLLSLCTGFAGASTPITTPTSSIPSTFFGLSENGVAAWSPWPSVNFGTLRMWDIGTRWSQVETSSGSYNWSKMDKVVNLARSNGKDLIYTFGGTPTWAASQPTQPCLYGYGSCSAPRSMSDLATFAKEVAARYAGKIKYYEIWNEPNDVHYYLGSTSSMVAMARTIYDAIKSVDSSAVILSPCPGWTTEGAPQIWMGSFLSAGGGTYFDVASFHAYPGSAPPETIISYVNNMRAVLDQKGYGNKELFVTEGGWGQNKYFSTEDQRVTFLGRYIVLTWAKGVQKLIWYSYDNASWGTLHASGGLTAGGIAYSQVYHWLVGNTMQGCAQDSNGTWACKLSGSNGYSAKILWNPSKTISYYVSGLTSIRSLSGALSSVSGSYVSVGAKPILVANQAR
jgi:hypothetical protein